MLSVQINEPKRIFSVIKVETRLILLFAKDHTLIVSEALTVDKASVYKAQSLQSAQWRT